MKKLLLALSILLIPCMVFAADVTLKWNPNSEADLAGYKVFYKPFGTATYNYTSPAWTGTETTCTVTVPGDGEFVARAFDQAGNESADSNTAKLDMAPTPPKNLLVEAIQNLAAAINNLAESLASR